MAGVRLFLRMRHGSKKNLSRILYDCVKSSTATFCGAQSAPRSSPFKTRLNSGYIQRECVKNYSTRGGSASICNSGKDVIVDWADQRQSRFQSIWLRHNCHCDSCKQADSGQKVIPIVDISPYTAITSTSIDGDKIRIVWDCGHTGVIPLEYLRNNGYMDTDLGRKAESTRLTPECTASSIPTMKYSELVQSKEQLLKCLWLVNKYGLSVLNGVPPDTGKVKEVASLIDRPMFTIYGETFDVLSTPQPINIAYSSVGLDLHMDLVYYESPPGLQLLHCLRFDDCVTGGESLFLDVFRVAEEFRQDEPDHFKTLVEVPATFQKVHYARESPVHMKFQRPHIVLNQNKEIVNCNWSPAFEGPLSVPESDVERYYVAYQKFAVALKTSKHWLIQRSNVGDLAIFNNRRILHGRESFQLNGGMRHLEGCYVNIDHFKNKLQVLSTTIGDGAVAKRVGNQDWL